MVTASMGAAALCRLLPGLGMIAVPNARSSHSTPTVVGVGVVVPVTVAAVALTLRVDIPGIVSVALGMAALGFLEDLRELSPVFRLAGQVMIALAGAVLVAPTWWLFLPAALAVVAAVNGLNFMDGINGITGTEGVLIGLTLAAVAYATSTPEWIYVGIALAAACFGYLPNNFPVARSFPGDVLPYFLGAIFILGLFDLAQGSTAALLGVGAIVPAAVDTSSTVVRRTLRGEKLTSPHRSHGYQRLSRLTSHSQATCTFLALSALGAASPLVAIASGNLLPGIIWLVSCTSITIFVLARVPLDA